MKEILIFLGLCAIALSILFGMTRSVAIEKGLTPQEYKEWMYNLYK